MILTMVSNAKYVVLKNKIQSCFLLGGRCPVTIFAVPGKDMFSIQISNFAIIVILF
jgi:hypothetical protein